MKNVRSKLTPGSELHFRYYGGEIRTGYFVRRRFNPDNRQPQFMIAIRIDSKTRKIQTFYVSGIVFVDVPERSDCADGIPSAWNSVETSN